ncbi:hypothetical protein BaRGS_00026799 [Batillaria attramentaria]|uniref:PH domain-containing protein n=1 Tax=Batillaria attramentaria TaxID=370345 RepID=A0ABD0K591_9CAEN
MFTLTVAATLIAVLRISPCTICTNQIQFVCEKSHIRQEINIKYLGTHIVVFSNPLGIELIVWAPACFDPLFRLFKSIQRLRDEEKLHSRKSLGVRTYYLATQTEEDMGTWVQCLCRVCGLKQEDTPTDIPDARMSQHGGTSMSAVNAASTGTLNRPQAAASPQTITTQPLQSAASRLNTTASSSTSSSNSTPAPSTSPQSYICLNECTTGTGTGPSMRHPSHHYGRTDSVDSVPEYQAPPPPIKKGTQHHNNNNNSRDRNSLHNSVVDVYDRPPQKSVEKMDVYDRPPRSTFDDIYDRPPPGSGSEVRSSQASIGSDDFYKVPPSHGDGSLLNITRGSTSSDKVDLSAAVPLPISRRSPHSARSSVSDRPESVDSMGRPMTETYDFPPPRPASIYDIPRASAIHQPPRESGLNVAPPPPQVSTAAAAAGPSYLNTVPGMNNSPSVPPLPDTYIPMKTGGDGRESPDIEYADMDAVPAVPSKSRTLPPSSDMSYSEMSGGGDLYQVPPVAPRPPVRTNTTPAVRPHTGGSIPEVAPVWSTQRTKSFKRNNLVSHSPQPPRPPPLVPRSQEPRRPPLPDPVASSSDDDADSIDGNNSLCPLQQTHHDPRVLRMSTVPAPPAQPDIDNEPELKYLDLDLDTQADPPRPQAAASHAAPTEYREIDFIKTIALQNTKSQARTHQGGK